MTDQRPRPARTRGRPHRAASSDRGDSTITTVIIWPVVLMLVWVVFQVVVYTLGRNVALDAARHGAAAGRLPPVDLREAQSIAHDYAADATLGWLTDIQVNATVVGDRVQVTVTATPAELVPFLDLGFSQTASAPIERITP